jgi:FkbM family methyltransferase
LGSEASRSCKVPLVCQQRGLASRHVNARLFVRRILRRWGYDFHALPANRLGLRDLQFDLPELVRSSSPVIFDVGANKGQTIELMRGCFPASQIVAFEPNPELHRELTSRFASDEVLIEDLAMGSACGIVDFNVLENDELSSVLELDRDPQNPFALTPIQRVVTVSMTTLDTYCSKRGGQPTIDILKIDTQGFDLEVLRGADGLISRCGVDVLLVEVNLAPLYRGQGTFGEIERFLANRGYGLLGLYEVARERGCIRWATACFRPMERAA